MYICTRIPVKVITFLFMFEVDLEHFNCQNPYIIFNRSLVDNIVKYGAFFEGRPLHLDLAYQFKNDFKSLSPWLNNVCSLDKNGNRCINESLANKYTTLDDNGNNLCLYMLVKCNHCDNCRCVKQNEISKILTLEGYSHSSRPFFVTLTYRNEQLPSDGVNVRHVQLFLKKLRHFFDNIRYFAVSEYGSKFKRPHYHLLIYGIDSSTPDAVTKFYNCCCLAWSSDNRSKNVMPSQMVKGRFLVKNQRGLVDVIVTDGRTNLFTYVGKYLLKSDIVPFGQNKLFYLCSRRPYLGSKFIPQIREWLLSKKWNTELLFNYLGKLVKIDVPKFFINKILPTLGTSFAFARKLYKDAVENVRFSFETSPILLQYEKNFPFICHFSISNYLHFIVNSSILFEGVNFSDSEVKSIFEKYELRKEFFQFINNKEKKDIQTLTYFAKNTHDRFLSFQTFV